MTEHTDPPIQYYRSLPLEVEQWLLDGLKNLNGDDSLDALGWPWFNVTDMRILLNRAYLANLTVYGIDCNILNQGDWEYAWTIIWEDYTDLSSHRHYVANWFFRPFEERVDLLAQNQSLELAVFSCSISRIHDK